MGSTFGIISLISGICSLIFPFLRIFMPFFGFWTIALPIIAIIFGIIGIAIDDSKARKEWGWDPKYDLTMMTDEMLRVIKEKHDLGLI